MAAQGENVPKPIDVRSRLEEMVARTSGATVPDHNLASPDVSYIGSMIDSEDVFPQGVRHRVGEKPLGRKVGYLEVGDEPEEADEEWITGEASQISGGGVRGSKNWFLKICFPILIVAIIICMHHWWWDIRKGLSKVIDDTADAFDRRLEAGAMGGILDQAREHERPLNVEGATMRTVWRGEKAVHKLDLEEGGADVGPLAP